MFQHLRQIPQLWHALATRTVSAPSWLRVLQLDQNSAIMTLVSFDLRARRRIVDKPDKQVIRQKIIGILLRHARLRAGRSQTELAAALHVSRYRYAQYERGQRDLSLPELELVAELCGVPLDYFFDEQAVVEDEGRDMRRLMASRIQHKIVGTLLRQGRQQANKSQKECASLLGISPRRFSQYESGKRPIPLSELETLAPYLGVSPSYFSS